MPTQQPPTLPAADQLAGLDPAVSITLLVATVILVVLFYFGSALADRVRKKPPEPPAPPAGASAPAVATPAVDAAAQVNSDFREHLKSQLSTLQADYRDLRADYTQLLEEKRRLQEEYDRYRYNNPPGRNR